MNRYLASMKTFHGTFGNSEEKPFTLECRVQREQNFDRDLSYFLYCGKMQIYNFDKTTLERFKHIVVNFIKPSLFTKETSWFLSL